MMRAFAAALLLTAASQSAHAAENKPLVRHSARCLIAVSTIGKLEHPDAVMLSNFALMFFAGKISGADPQADIAALIEHEARNMDEKTKRALLEPCVGELESRGSQVEDAIGQALGKLDLGPGA